MMNRVTEYLNVNAYFDYSLTILPGSEAGIPRALYNFETTRATAIPIPAEVLSIYSRFRPTRLFRARHFEKALGTNCEIFIKDESTTPTGNHKANSAYLIAYLCGREGIRELTTETTGNWGVALAIAARDFGMRSTSFLDEVSNRQRPGTRRAIESRGGKVVIVKLDDRHHDLLKLSADAAIGATRMRHDAAYVFGSVYGYFVIPQSIMGVEAHHQLAAIGKYPDVVVGSCGGGANLLGIAAPFLIEKLAVGREVSIVSAESENCPILSTSRLGYYSVDSLGYYPALHTYGLDGLSDAEYIGGLGSTIVASAAAHFHHLGLIRATVMTSRHAQEAAGIFQRTEGIRVALETAYQLAAVADESRRMDNGVILANISSGENDAEFYNLIE